MGSYRSKFDIIADILHVVEGETGAKKTRIMYGANLNYSILTRYLTEVLKACLIRFEKSKKCYLLTAKGIEFLEYYRDYSRRNKHVAQQMETMNAKKKVLEGLCSV